MARIPLDHPRSLFVRAMTFYSRRKFGDVLEPGLALAHNRRVLLTSVSTESKVARWTALDPTLKALATLVTAGEIGCSWCMDFGLVESANRGVAVEKLRAIASWSDSEVYTDDERAVLGYAVAMTATPPTVTDAMVEDLRTRLSDEQLVELTAVVALENQRSRVNAALGLTSQGFADVCELRSPADKPGRAAVAV